MSGLDEANLNVDTDVNVKQQGRIHTVQIGELAERTGVSTRSLRHYDREGLLPSTRLSNGYRDFLDGAVDQVARIRVLLDVGLSLNQARPLMPCFMPTGELGGCDALRETLDEQVYDLDEQISRLLKTRNKISMTVSALGSAPGLVVILT